MRAAGRARRWACGSCCMHACCVCACAASRCLGGVLTFATAWNWTAQGTEIRGTFFNDDVDKFYDMLQNDKVYLFSNGRVKIANKRFSNLDNDHEITFGRDTVIQMVAEDNRICRTQYKFIKISDVEKLDKGATCDVLGYISTVRDVVEFTTRAGKQSCKRDIELVDSSGTKVRMTLWGYVRAATLLRKTPPVRLHDHERPSVPPHPPTAGRMPRT